MGQTGRRCLFTVEAFLSLAVVGLAIYLLVEAPYYENNYYNYTDLRIVIPRLLISIGIWSFIFSLYSFFGSFSKPSDEVALKSSRIAILLVVLAEALTWSVALALTAFEAWDDAIVTEKIEWDMIVVAAGCSGAMVAFEFVNLVLACVDIRAKSRADRMVLAGKADLESRMTTVQF